MFVCCENVSLDGWVFSNFLIFQFPTHLEPGILGCLIYWRLGAWFQIYRELEDQGSLFRMVFRNYFAGIVVILGRFVFIRTLIQVCLEGFGENTKINSLCCGVGD